MKHLACTVLFLALFSIQHSNAQDYLDLMEDYSVNVYEVIAAGNQYFENHHKGKGSGWKNFQRWIADNEPLFYPSGDRSQFDPSIAYKEFEKFKSNNPSTKNNNTIADWQDLGPNYAYNHLPTDWAPGVGRVETMHPDPTDDNIIYLGSRSGGFWKTQDGGTTWYSTTQDLAAVGVVDIEIHPTNHNEIYIVTRHSTGYSLGILKSTDYGETWTTTGLSLDVTNYRRLYDLYICPDDADVMYCSANNGIYKTIDGGVNWDRPITSNTRSMMVKPDDCDAVYWIQNSSKDIARRSADGLVTQTSTTIVDNNNSSSRLAVTAANTDMLYFVSNNGIWRSTNGGVGFTRMGDAPTSIMAVGVLDTDADKVIIGGLDHFRSADGGASFTQFTSWADPNSDNYVHADGRSIRSWDGIFYMGTDGYLGKSTDGGDSWFRLNDEGTGIREFYRIGVSTTKADKVIGGSQDNGTSILINGVWYEWIGADGMEAHLDRNNAENWFGTIQLGSLQYTSTDGTSRSGIRPQSDDGKWITPSVLDPNNDNTIFILYDVLYKSNNNGQDWETLADLSAYGNMAYLAISPSDSNYLYVAEDEFILRSTDNGASFTLVNTGLPDRSISRIAVHPHEPETVAVTYTGYGSDEKVFISYDGGDTWENISNNLPNLPANCLVFEDVPENRIYVGMDAGVYYLDDNNTDWILYDDGLPVIEITDMDIQQGANLLRVCTWGRGLWESPLLGKSDFPKIMSIDMTPKATDVRPSDHDDVQVMATLTDDGTIASARLIWGVDGITFNNSIDMNLSAGDVYELAETLPRQDMGTRFYFKIETTDNDGNTTVSDKIVYKITEAILCSAEGASGTGSDWINLVEINDLSNSSGKTAYSDFSHLSTTLERNSTHQLRIQLNHAFGLDRGYAWIDWNNNLIFDAESEEILMSDFDNNNSYGTFTVPADARLGTTLMRVRNIYSTNPFHDPCNTYAGEVEDYSIVIENAPLSVHWLHFKATAEKEQVQLKWSTAQELFNDYFVVQRSQNLQQWEDLKKVNANDRGQNTNRYQMVDEQPYLGLSYYRLKAIDINGKAVVSPTQTVQFLPDTAPIVLYPNPATKTATLTLEAGFELSSLEVVNVLGQVVSVPYEMVDEQVRLSVSVLSEGVYFVKIGDGQRYFRGELVVKR